MVLFNVEFYVELLLNVLFVGEIFKFIVYLINNGKFIENK